MVLSEMPPLGHRSSSCNFAKPGVDATTAVIELLLENHDWSSCLQLVVSVNSLQCPRQKQLDALCTNQQQAPAGSLWLLHKACRLPQIPAVLLQAFVQTWPQACLATCPQTHMTPLHLLIQSVHSTTNKGSISEHIILSYVHALLAMSSTCSRRNMVQLALQTPTCYSGELPLHTACRVGASLSLIALLVQSYPRAVNVTCKRRGCNPLALLWKPYENHLPETTTSAAQESRYRYKHKDLPRWMTQQQLWAKTIILLQAMADTSNDDANGSITESSRQKAHSKPPTSAFHPLHAAASIRNCPRIVLQWAAHLYSATYLDEHLRTPLHCAAKSPSTSKAQPGVDEGNAASQQNKSVHCTYKQLVELDSKWTIDEDGEFDYEQLERDMQNEDDLAYVSEDESEYAFDLSSGSGHDETILCQVEMEASPIECILLAEKAQQSLRNHAGQEMNATASWKDQDGRLPLHWACATDKDWLRGGLHALIKAFPDGLQARDPITGLWPFQLAAAPSCDSVREMSTRSTSPQHQNSGKEVEKLATIYELLRAHPSALEPAVSTTQSKRRRTKRKRTSTSHQPMSFHTQKQLCT